MKTNLAKELKSLIAMGAEKATLTAVRGGFRLALHWKDPETLSGGGLRFHGEKPEELIDKAREAYKLIGPSPRTAEEHEEPE